MMLKEKREERGEKDENGEKKEEEEALPFDNLLGRYAVWEVKYF